MLIVDINALLTVDLLDLLNDVVAYTGTAELIVVNAADTQNIMRAECAAGELLTLIDMVAVLDENACRVRYGIDLGLALFLVDNTYRKQCTLLGLLYADSAGDFGKYCHLLGLACLE